MFTYINPEIRERLIRDGKLRRINSDGEPVETDSTASPGQHLNLLGPSPCRSLEARSTPQSDGMPVLEAPS